jgi:hypothetical protein
MAVVVFLSALAGLGVSCLTKAQTQAVITDITPAGACIVTQLLQGGATDPLQIVTACSGTTIADVIEVIEELMAASDATVDAGGDAGASAMTLSVRLHAMHVGAVGLLGVTVAYSDAGH